jgi:hypothetical protein
VVEWPTLHQKQIDSDCQRATWYKHYYSTAAVHASNSAWVQKLFNEISRSFAGHFHRRDRCLAHLVRETRAYTIISALHNARISLMRAAIWMMMMILIHVESGAGSFRPLSSSKRHVEVCCALGMIAALLGCPTTTPSQCVVVEKSLESLGTTNKFWRSIKRIKRRLPRYRILAPMMQCRQ